MKVSDGFIYVENSRVLTGGDALVVRIDSGIRSPKQIFDLFYHSLSLPGYFGFNWNALFDCLCDLHWIDKRTVAIVHDELPQLSGLEMTTYLSLLSESAVDWHPWEDHSVQVVFNDKDRASVEAALRERKFA